MDSKVYIYQDGNIPGDRIIEELKSRGGLNNGSLGSQVGVFYYIGADMRIKRTYYSEEILKGYSKLRYSPGNDTFYEADSQWMQSARAKEALLPDDVRKVNVVEKNGALEVNIPEGYEAKVEYDKVIIRKRVWKPKVGDECYRVELYADAMVFHISTFQIEEEGDLDFYEGGWLFETEEEAKAFCSRLNDAIGPLADERRKELDL